MARSSGVRVKGYEERFVAYIDVLGFRDVLKGNESQQILTYFEAIRTAIEVSAPTLEYRVIGDAIVLSISTGDETVALEWLKRLLEAVARIQLHLAFENIWTRGAVTRGHIHFSDEEFFAGHALARAYELESKVAKYPRVIVDPLLISSPPFGRLGIDSIDALIEAVNRVESGEGWPDRVLYDWNRPNGDEFLAIGTIGRPNDLMEKDVPLIVDYLSPFIRKERGQQLLKLIEIIEERSKSSIEHYEKYSWVARYLLATVMRDQNVDISSAPVVRLNKL